MTARSTGQDSGRREFWRRQRRPLIAVAGCWIAAAVLVLLDFPGARLIAGALTLVALGCLFAIRYHLRRYRPSDPHGRRRHLRT